MSAFADENGAENEELSRPRGDGPWNGESSSSDDDGDLLILADGRKEEGDALWDDWYADEDEQERYRCLFCSLDFTEIPPLLDHCTDQHGFDYRKVKKDTDLDFYGTIKLINYIRRKVRDEPASLTRLSDADLDEMTCLGDEFLIPVMEDDALLRDLDDADDENTNAEATAIAGPTPISGSDKNIAELEKQLCQSQRELSCVMDQFELYRKFVRENFL